MIGKKFDPGLANMKAVAEKQAAETHYANSFLLGVQLTWRAR
jgi:hypothetical protein